MEIYADLIAAQAWSIVADELSRIMATGEFSYQVALAFLRGQ